ELNCLKQKWGIYTPDSFRQRAKELGTDWHLIEGLVPQRSLGLVIGDSGLGKSPLLYQIALCVAAGVPFLGRKVNQGKVLFLDFENGIGEVSEMIDNQKKYLGLSEDPKDLLLWNFADHPSQWGRSGLTGLDMIRDVKPALTIIDSLGSYDPEIEEKNANAGKANEQFREVIKATGSSIFSAHHIRKPSMKFDDTPPSLEDGNLLRWFLQARGARALINGSDVRLGV